MDTTKNETTGLMREADYLLKESRQVTAANDGEARSMYKQQLDTIRLTLVQFEHTTYCEDERSRGRFECFMLLPAEIRIMITRYAMTADVPLKWMYTTCTADRMVGTFRHIDQLTALSRTSKAVYRETNDLVWKHNQLEFDPLNSGFAYTLPGFKATDRTMARAAHKALKLFYKNAPAKVIHDVEIVYLRVKLPHNNHQYIKPTKMMYQLFCLISQQYPEFKIRIIDHAWSLGILPRPGGRLEDLQEDQLTYFLLNRGEWHKSLTQAEGMTKETRSWRIHPSLLPGTVESLRKVLTGDKWKSVDNMIENGV